MKNLFLLLLALSPLFLKAQLNEWLPNQAMTDSTHNNRNACLYGQYTENFLFWDQELNSTTTQLCYRSIYSSSVGEEHVALFQQNVKITNPKILGISYGLQPPEFLVLYQTNEGNNIDLKSILYKLDGTFSQPVAVGSLPGDDLNLTISENGIAAWENSGKIWVSQYLYTDNSFTSPFAIDSAGAYSPAFSSFGLNYLKANGDSTTLISMYLTYTPGNWEISSFKTHSIAGECSALVSSVTPLGNMNKCLQNKTGINPWGLIIVDDWNSASQYLNSSTYNYTQPTICDYMIGVKSNAYILAYVSDSLSQKEIFAQTPIGGLYNVSRWPGDDQNPKIFESFPSYSIIRANLFWESERNGFSTIYRSYYDYLFGGLDETVTKDFLEVRPCPFVKETNILVRSSGYTRIRILDLQGREVKTLSPQKELEGRYQATWDGTNNSGKNVPAGCYAVIAISGHQSQSRIIIKE